MNNKTSKFILKALILFPVGFIVGLVINKGEFSDLLFPILLALIYSFSVIFYNLFITKNTTKWIF